MEDIMKQSGADMKKYQSAKKLYGNTANMMKALNNELSSQGGNMAVSLPAIIAAGGELATGNVPGALATAGMGEFIKRRGAGITASQIQNLYKAFPRMASRVANALQILRRKPNDQGLSTPTQQ